MRAVLYISGQVFFFCLGACTLSKVSKQVILKEEFLSIGGPI